MHQGKVGDSRAKVLGNNFLIVPTVSGMCQVSTLGSLPPMEFSAMWGEAKSWANTICVYPQGRAYTRALKMKSC